MRKELDEKLCTLFPKIFADRKAFVGTSAMCWGFECGDGWYEIIYHLCSNIQEYIDGRQAATDRAIEHNAKNEAEGREYRFKVPEPVTQVIAVQVKEKFGGLRFYVHGGDEVTDHYITFAENMSYRVCDECGHIGQLYKGGWWHTKCEEHEAAYKTKKGLE